MTSARLFLFFILVILHTTEIYAASSSRWSPRTWWRREPDPTTTTTSTTTELSTTTEISTTTLATEISSSQFVNLSVTGHEVLFVETNTVTKSIMTPSAAKNGQSSGEIKHDTEDVILDENSSSFDIDMNASAALIVSNFRQPVIAAQMMEETQSNINNVENSDAGHKVDDVTGKTKPEPNFNNKPPQQSEKADSLGVDADKSKELVNKIPQEVASVSGNVDLEQNEIPEDPTAFKPAWSESSVVVKPVIAHHDKLPIVSADEAQKHREVFQPQNEILPELASDGLAARKHTRLEPEALLREKPEPRPDVTREEQPQSRVENDNKPRFTDKEEGRAAVAGGRYGNGRRVINSPNGPRWRHNHPDWRSTFTTVNPLHRSAERDSSTQGKRQIYESPVTDFLCTFDDHNCGFRNQEQMKTEWKAAGDDKGIYLSATSSGHGLARLITPYLPGFRNATTACLKFEYILTGNGANKLSIIAQDKGNRELLVLTAKTTEWRSVQHTIPIKQDLRFFIEAQTDDQSYGTISLDNFAYTKGSCHRHQSL